MSVNAKKKKAVLPIGRTARIACQLDILRFECCQAAAILTRERTIDECELEECARLDDALARTQRLLKSTVAGIILSRLKRRSQQDAAND